MALPVLPPPATSWLEIRGGRPLAGTVAVSGAKNAALPILAASVLAQGPVVLEGIPAVGDVDTMLALLRHLGCNIALHTCQGNPSTNLAPPLWLHLTNQHAGDGLVEPSLPRQMRAGFCLLGPLLARYGRATLALPGGCRIGPRPVELHLRGLAALGAKIEFGEGHITAKADRLQGAEINLTGPHGSTVTGTINVMSAATLARGTTIIHGAAREPEVVDTGRFLQILGANITGLGTACIQIAGVDCLGGGAYRVIPDRIEAATLLLAAAIAGGEVTVTGVMPAHLTEVCHLLQQAGGQLDIGPHRIGLAMGQRPLPFSAIAEPYPGLPTDLQAPFTALACLASGRSTLVDRVFPERFAHLAGLLRLGATISRQGSTIHVEGALPLRASGPPLCLPTTDLRGAAALVLAALGTSQPVCVQNIEHLDRGYQQLESKLASLGADIIRVPRPHDAKVRPLPALPATAFA